MTLRTSDASSGLPCFGDCGEGVGTMLDEATQRVEGGAFRGDGDAGAVTSHRSFAPGSRSSASRTPSEPWSVPYYSWLKQAWLAPYVFYETQGTHLPAGAQLLDE